jgi:hypothetical protein
MEISMSETGSRPTADESRGPAGFTAAVVIAPPPPDRPTEREFTVEERTRTSMVVSRFLQHRLAFASLVFFVLLVLLVYLAPPLFGLDYKAVDNPPRLSPSVTYPLGTDEIGHNYLALVLRGSRQSMNIAFIVAIMSTAFGAPYGAIAAHFGGKTDAIMMRIVDVILTLPFIVITAALAEHYGGTWYTVAILLGLVGWVINARLTRSAVLSVPHAVLPAVRHDRADLLVHQLHRRRPARRARSATDQAAAVMSAEVRVLNASGGVGASPRIRPLRRRADRTHRARHSTESRTSASERSRSGRGSDR